jgi:diamine N-acetyltransferase
MERKQVAGVHLRPVTADNLAECLALRVADAQAAFVASNAKSLAEAYVNPTLVPLAVYGAAARGWEKDPPASMVGFTMYELAAGVGFILRLMIDQGHQGKGYGRAAMVEVIRRLRLHPEVEMIATSHSRGNEAAAALYRGLGFVDWDIGYARVNPNEVYLMLPEDEKGA